MSTRILVSKPTSGRGQFQADEDLFEIVEVEDRWYDPNGEYFKVRTTEGERYILRYDDREGQWSLQSGFDGGRVAGSTRS